MAIIYSKGFQQSITNDGSKSKPQINEIEWDTNYKNNQGTMSVNINKNGKKNKYQIKVNKNDLEKMLQIPAVNESLEQRLIDDFSILDTSFPKQNVLNKNKSKSNYDELEDLFNLRKKLMRPYHLTHTQNMKSKSKKSQKKKKTRKQGKRNKK